MVATELITGMEDIVQHIKELEEKNRKLQEENKKLQEENQTLHCEYHELNHIAFESGSSVEALEEENKKMEEEIEELKSNLDYDPEQAEIVCKDFIKKLQEEQLTEENAIQYVYENTDEYDDWVYGSTLYQELQEKNKKLQLDYDTRGDIVKGLKETIDKLKEEHNEFNEIWKTERITEQDIIDWRRQISDQCDLIKKLKEENKKLKEMSRDKVRELVAEYFCGERVSRNPEVSTSYTIYDWDSEEESESEEEEEKCALEINVVGLGFCQYENEEERDKQVVYCKNGCWKLKGDKTAKDDEGNYCETDEEE